jgi:hypothetical protein
MLIVQAVRMRVPAVVLARIVLNAAIDMLLGFIPIAGDLADIGFKANLRNLALLERHARPGVEPAKSDYVFVTICLIVLAFVALAPFVVLFWVVTRWKLI